MVSCIFQPYRGHLFFKAGDQDVTPLTILIGDGNDSSRRRLKDLLKRSGYLVEAEASNAPDLLRKARTMFPDLVIMDSSLDGGSVQEIAGIIEGDEISSVLVLVQGPKFRIPDDIAHIQKPYTEETLLTVIEVLLLYQNRLYNARKEVSALKDSIQTRKNIEKAKGILMKHLDIDEAEAYRKMQKESMNHSVSMQEMAQAILAAYKS